MSGMLASSSTLIQQAARGVVATFLSLIFMIVLLMIDPKLLAIGGGYFLTLSDGSITIARLGFGADL